MIETPKKAGYRMPAEYEPHHGTLMIWPTRPGSWPFQGKAAKRAFSQIIKTIAEGERVYLLVEQDHLSEAQSYLGEKVVYLDIPTNDAWARDTGPTILINDKNISILLKESNIDLDEIKESIETEYDFILDASLDITDKIHQYIQKKYDVELTMDELIHYIKDDFFSCIKRGFFSAIGSILLSLFDTVVIIIAVFKNRIGFIIFFYAAYNFIINRFLQIF